MKRIILVILTLLMVFSLVGCDKGSQDNWYSGKFTLENKQYTLPITYKQLNDAGWVMDEEDRELAPGEYTDEYIELYNENFYDEESNLYITLLVEFENSSKESKKLTECDIWWISFSTVEYLGVSKDKGYKVTLPKNITFGATEQEIVNAYGVVEDGNRYYLEENNIVALVYKYVDNEMFTQLSLFIGENGLFEIDLERYNIGE